jgi:hypothetical protein
MPEQSIWQTVGQMVMPGLVLNSPMTQMRDASAQSGAKHASLQRFGNFMRNIPILAIP